jgi:hypothetical protein
VFMTPPAFSSSLAGIATGRCVTLAPWGPALVSGYPSAQ